MDKGWLIIIAGFAFCAWVLLDVVPNHGKCGKCGSPQGATEGVEPMPNATPQVATASADHVTIRVASDDPQMPWAVAQANQRIAHIGVALQLVPRNAAADVTVEFVDNINPPGAGGSYMGSGLIHISNNRRSNDLAGILIHEVIHAGGYLTHDDEVSSVMYGTTAHGRDIWPAHADALRSLASGGLFTGSFSLIWLVIPVGLLVYAFSK